MRYTFRYIILRFRSGESVWLYLSGIITGIFALFTIFEIIEVLKIFLAKPIQLNSKQSKLLNAKGIDFEVTKKSKQKSQVNKLYKCINSITLNRLV